VKNDSGLYQCVATNEAGEVWAAARLTVNAKGGSPPTNVTCTTDDAPGSITVSWKDKAYTKQQGKELAYTIHYTPTGKGQPNLSPPST